MCPPAHLLAGWMPWASLHMGSFHHQPPPPQPPTHLAHNTPSSPVQFISTRSYKTMGNCNSSPMFIFKQGKSRVQTLK